MIHPDEEEHLAEAYFTYVNDVIGLFAIALAATSLQFEQPAPFARLFDNNYITHCVKAKNVQDIRSSLLL
ncbi:hypothetical protein ACFSJQ_06055 [Vibrio olivae]